MAVSISLHPAANLAYSILLRKVLKTFQTIKCCFSYFFYCQKHHLFDVCNFFPPFLLLSSDRSKQKRVILEIDETETWLGGIDHLYVLLVGSMRLLLPAATWAYELGALLSTECIEADGIDFELRMLWAPIVEDFLFDEVLAPFTQLADGFTLHILLYCQWR